MSRKFPDTRSTNSWVPIRPRDRRTSRPSSRANRARTSQAVGGVRVPDVGDVIHVVDGGGDVVRREGG